MGKKRRGAITASARTERGASDSSQGRVSATPAPRKRPRREIPRFGWRISAASTAQSKRVGRNQRLNQAANTGDLARSEPHLFGARQMRRVAGVNDPAQAVGQ